MALFYHCFFSFFIISFFTFSSSAPISHDHQDHDHKINGFSIELIHRDSPKSPLFNSSETPSQRLINALTRFINRKNHLIMISTTTPKATSASSSSSSISPNQVMIPPVFPAGGEYLVKISIGTPPFSIYAIVDTGSDLTWTQCKPCTRCFTQPDPLFDPSSSATYKNVPCRTDTCMSVTGSSWAGAGPGQCPYSAAYGDGSHTNGYLATDTLTMTSAFGRPISFPGFIFGCGKDNGGTFDQFHGSGIVGLGNREVSLVSQLSSSIDSKFSYCFLPPFSEYSSKLNFGTNAVVSGPGTVSTPLFPDGLKKTFHYLTMEGISVGDTRLPFSGEISKGNTIIDSGTTFTVLPSDFYSDLELAVAAEIDLQRVDSPIEHLRLCYNISHESERDFHAPTLTVHFSGADVKLSTVNTFARFAKDTMCFTFQGDSLGGLNSIYGNFAQINFLVGYNTQKMIVSFKPTDCSKT